MSWVLFIYAVAALASSLAAILAWAAKLWWAKEYGAAKDEIIKAKEAQIEILNREVQHLKELTPMKIREYFLSVKVQLEEYNDLLQSQLNEAQFKIKQKDAAISGVGARYIQSTHAAKDLLLGMEDEKLQLENRVAAIQEELERVRTEKENSQKLWDEVSKGGVFLLPNNMYLSVSSKIPDIMTDIVRKDPTTPDVQE